MKKLYFTLFILIFSSSMTTSAEELKAYTPGDVHNLFSTFVENKNIDGLGSLFGEHAIMLPGKDQAPIIGRENIKKALGAQLNSFKSINTLSKSVHINGNTALVKSVWEITTKNGEAVRGTATEVMREQPDGRWVYYIDNPFSI